jgi:predicted aspartyl protease
MKYIVAASPGPMSLAVDVEIESTDTVVRQCMQALVDCGATGCFIDIEWAKLNNIPTRPLTKPIPVYNVDSTTNDAGMITDITNVILRYENHSEHTQLAVTRLGKQSMILGYNWLHNHNPEINWQTKEVKMSRCPHQCSTCRVEDKCEAKIRKSTTLQINACWAGAFPMMVEEVDEDESPVRGHPSVSLLPLSSPTLHLFICIPLPHLCTIFKDHT